RGTKVGIGVRSISCAPARVMPIPQAITLSASAAIRSNVDRTTCSSLLLPLRRLTARPAFCRFPSHETTGVREEFPCLGKKRGFTLQAQDLLHPPAGLGEHLRP